MGKLHTIPSGEYRGEPDRGPASLQACSCIIPFYNEGYRVCRVVQTIRQVNGIGRIVCVDDGSDDGGAELLYRTNPDVKLLRLPKNIGKAGAVAEGLNGINTPYFLLVTAYTETIVPVPTRKGERHPSPYGYRHHSPYISTFCYFDTKRISYPESKFQGRSVFPRF